MLLQVLLPETKWEDLNNISSDLKDMNQLIDYVTKITDVKLKETILLLSFETRDPVMFLLGSIYMHYILSRAAKRVELKELEELENLVK
jgi:hypothetical protein